MARARGRGARLRGPVLSPADPASEAASAALRLHLRAFASHEAGAHDGDVESIHQLRVATRRLRATLALFESVLPEEAARRAGDELAWLGRAIGAVRDLDVLLLAVPARARRLHSATRDALAPLDAALRARRETAHAALLRALDSPRCRTLLAGLRTFGGGRRSRALADVAHELAKPLTRSVHRAGRHLDADAEAEAFHRLRVRIKRLRYGLETLRGLGGRKLGKMLRRLEAVQELLGEVQDAVAQRARLEEVATVEPLPAATLVAVGALVEVLDRRGRKRRKRFPELWRRLDRRGLRRGVLKELARQQGTTRGRVLRMVRRTGT